MHTYTRLLKKFIEPHADPLKAAPMKKYMRDQFEYLGIKSPQMTKLHKEFIAERGLPPLTELDEIIRDLWGLPQREFQYLALGLIGGFEKKVDEDFITTLEYLITTKSWWDTVDTIAGHPVGTMFKRFPAVKKTYLKKWRKSENFWLRRTTLLFQLGYKEDTDFELLCDLVRENLGSDEFFINKAIGWALRQYAHTNPEPVRKFVKATKELGPLSRREALKTLNKAKSSKTR